ncbi:hypothetical protein AB6A40_007968 [Gnathostoma spinigerum]|uniref:Uncharacterized protein n=1 Tax=Gnathostoma spinigerum TaxID=75299 RepID=A0ABD6EVH7_9BILA
MLISSPTAIKRILAFLNNGRFIHCMVYFCWFLSLFLLIIGSVMYTMLVPTPFGSISKGVGTSFGMASCVLCAFGAFQSLHAWSYCEKRRPDEKQVIPTDLSTLV